MSKIDSAYNYYLANYGSQEVSRYDSHKKSELRNVYNRIVKSNKESPLFKLADPDSAKKYAIDIKQNAKAIQNVVASLSEGSNSEASKAFEKKVAISSNEDSVSANYVGDGNDSSSIDSFHIEVKELAKPQINTGNFVDSKALSIIPGDYSFDLTIGNSSYEFQYSVSAGEHNLDIQQKLARLFHSAGLGIDAEVLEKPNGTSALQITSKQTGLAEGETSLFNITPGTSAESIQAMDLLGIDHITSNASNSSFLLNGKERSSYSNTFTINNTIELTLKHASNEGSNIGFKANIDAVADNVQKLTDAYNNILKTAAHYNESTGQSNLLLNDMRSVAQNNKSELNHIGLMVDEQGNISIDKEILEEAISPERCDQTYDILAKFKNQIGYKAENAAINPMNYVNKVVVAYKNPGHNFANPYISSIYSGMMLDGYT